MTLTPIEPADAREAAQALGEAARSGRTVRIRGAGSKDRLGELLPTDVVMRTARMHGVVDHVPADLTVTVGAGTPLADVQRMLAQSGQFLPLDPPHASMATVGGIIAANSNGFGVLRYGAVRDLLIGTKTALADGTVARAGGRVVKNVAGYDLNKLLVGSFGALGVITEATFKVLPLPAARAGAVRVLPDAAAAFRIADAIVRTSLRPTALIVERAGRQWRLVVAAAGEPPVVERTLREAGGDRVTDAERVVEPLRELPAAALDGAVVRAVLPLAAQCAFAENAAAMDGFERLVADAGSGIAYVHLGGDDQTVAASAAALMAAARVVGGHARAESRSPSLIGRIAPWGDAHAAGDFLMRRLKQAFDPNGILEPGRAIA